jgi:hypothetical protein
VDGAHGSVAGHLVRDSSDYFRRTCSPNARADSGHYVARLRFQYRPVVRADFCRRFLGNERSLADPVVPGWRRGGACLSAVLRRDDGTVLGRLVRTRDVCADRGWRLAGASPAALVIVRQQWL